MPDRISQLPTILYWIIRPEPLPHIQEPHSITLHAIKKCEGQTLQVFPPPPMPKKKSFIKLATFKFLIVVSTSQMIKKLNILAWDSSLRIKFVSKATAYPSGVPL